MDLQNIDSLILNLKIIIQFLLQNGLFILLIQIII